MFVFSIMPIREWRMYCFTTSISDKLAATANVNRKKLGNVDQFK